MAVKIDRKEVLDVIKNQAGKAGTVKMSDDIICLLLDCSKRTVNRILNDLEKDGLIERHSKRRNFSGNMVTDRYIVITDGKYRYRGFSTQQHLQLSNKANHKARYYTNLDGTLTWEWWRRYDGKWELNMPDKVWRNRIHVYEFINYSVNYHKQMYKNGMYYNINE